MLPHCGKNSEEYSRKIAGQDHEVDIDFPWQSATFDNPVLVQNVRSNCIYVPVNFWFQLIL